MILGLFVFFVLLYFIYANKKENFRNVWWNVSPSTRNMSYDLRCEPRIPKKKYPFYGSSIQPLIRPKCLR